MARRVTVCCSNATTGGPEALHQLVDALRSFGHDARIAYYPFDEPIQRPEAYRRYDAPQAQLRDSIGDLVIVPETATAIALGVTRADVAVWWLSADNYFGRKLEPALVDLLARGWRLLRQRQMPLRRMRRFSHYAQSQYAHEFLARAGIGAPILSDYLGPEHLEPSADGETRLERADIVVYNPKKGHIRTRRLLEANPDLKFVPIQSMTSLQVKHLLATAKLYIDFGNHPGKDRLPREAAMAGCCVVTGRHGSANNVEDVPLPEEYKLDDRTDSYVRAFGAVTRSVFADFEMHSSRLAGYRHAILAEPDVFRDQVKQIFGDSRQS